MAGDGVAGEAEARVEADMRGASGGTKAVVGAVRAWGGAAADMAGWCGLTVLWTRGGRRWWAAWSGGNGRRVGVVGGLMQEPHQPRSNLERLGHRGGVLQFAGTREISETVPLPLEEIKSP
jgi:hypothetical protein